MTTHPPVTVRPEIARDFVAHSFHPDDWVALFGKAYNSGRVLQWVTPVATVCERRWLTWLQVMNAYRFNVYVSVNAMTPGRRQRTKASVSAVRHVFLDVDHDGPEALQSLMSRCDVPVPSCVVHSSPGRIQVLWRVQGFRRTLRNACRNTSRGEFGGDRAATAMTQTMRVPGFLNHKYAPPPLVSVEYGAEGVFGPADFPQPAPDGTHAATPVARRRDGHESSPDVVARARRYLAAVPPAVAGRRRRPAHVSPLLSPRARVRARRGRGAGPACRVECPLRAALDRARVDGQVGARPALRARTGGRTPSRAAVERRAPRVSSPRTRHTARALHPLRRRLRTPANVAAAVGPGPRQSWRTPWPSAKATWCP